MKPMPAAKNQIVTPLKPLAAALAMALPLTAWSVAQDESAPASSQSSVELSGMTVSGNSDRPKVPKAVMATSSIESVTAEQIRTGINAVSTAAVLEYQPSTHVRERYIGDVNGVLVMRVNSSIQAAETLVYADGMLISNLLGNSFNYAPRWGVVGPAEIERVDLIYGPFSALYAGNSEGGVVNISTKMPNTLEVHAGVDYLEQQFSAMGSNSRYYGNHEALSLGNKVGDLRFLVSMDHTDNTGQPMTFNIPTVASGSKTAIAGAIPVTGAFNFTGVTNQPTLATAAIGIDHSLQDNAKLKFAYDFSPSLTASYIFDNWQNKANKTAVSYLKNANTGAAVYGGPVMINGLYYTVASPAFSTQTSDYAMHGVKIKTNSGGLFDWEAAASLFRQDRDEIRTATASNSNVSLANATSGTLAVGNGTGWKNLDLRGDFRPDGGRNSRHQLSFGYHFDQYRLNTVTYNLTAGSHFTTSNPGSVSALSKGQTETQALYLQDVWKFLPGWEWVTGARFERWQASDGNNLANNSNVFYPNRSASAFSPKLAVNYQAGEDWGLRAAYGRATRFPTVNELFANITPQTTAGGTLSAAQVAALPAPYNAPTNNPNLKPERVDSFELTAEWRTERASWRHSLFAEYKTDAIIATTDAVSLPGYLLSGNTNIDAIHTFGFETAAQEKDLGLRGLDLAASATWVKSTITADAGNPILVGTTQPRIPRFRATVVSTYHVNDKFSFSVNYRYSGPQNVSLYTAAAGYNVPNPNAYGTTVSSYSVVDVKALYQIDKNWSASLGINNLNNCVYYVNPNPYPMRTLFASVKYDL